MKKFFEETLWIFLTPIMIFGGIGYMIYSGITEKTPALKNHQECSYILYYDTTGHRFKAKYVSSIYYDDSLVNFTDQQNKTWWQKDFASYEQRDDSGDYISDITLKNGNRYKVSDISPGGCKINAVEDSLHNDLINSTEDDESNNN